MEVGQTREVNGRKYSVEQGKLETCEGCDFLDSLGGCELHSVHKQKQMCADNRIIYKYIEMTEEEMSFYLDTRPIACSITDVDGNEYSIPPMRLL